MFTYHQAKQVTQALIQSGNYVQVEHNNASYGIHRDYYQQYVNHQAAQNPCSIKQYNGCLAKALGVPAVAIIPM